MEEKQKKFAVWSLVLGIVGLIFGCMFLGLPASHHCDHFGCEGSWSKQR